MSHILRDDSLVAEFAEVQFPAKFLFVPAFPELPPLLPRHKFAVGLNLIPVPSNSAIDLGLV